MSSELLSPDLRDRILQGGGAVTVNSDGSISLAPAASKNAKVTGGTSALEVQNSTNDNAGTYLHGQGTVLKIEVDSDLNGTLHDLIDCRNTGSGDGLWMVHQGGIVSGVPSTGGAAGLNVLVPQYLDWPVVNNGRTGSTPNTKTNQSGLYIEVQTTDATQQGISLRHYAGGPALYINNQPTDYAGGNGPGIQIDHRGTGAALNVDVYSNAYGVVINQNTGYTATPLLVRDYGSSGGSVSLLNAENTASRNALVVTGYGDSQGRIRLTYQGVIRIGSGSAAADTLLFRAAAGVLGLQNNTPATSAELVIYGTAGSALFPTDYERIRIRESSNQFQIITEAGGTGSTRSLFFGVGGAVSWGVRGSSSAFVAVNDGTNDIGESTQLRPRNGYFTGGVAVKVKAGTPADADFTNPVDGMLATDSTGNKIWVRLSGTWKGVAVA